MKTPLVVGCVLLTESSNWHPTVKIQCLAVSPFPLCSSNSRRFYTLHWLLLGNVVLVTVAKFPGNVFEKSPTFKNQIKAPTLIGRWPYWLKQGRKMQGPKIVIKAEVKQFCCFFFPININQTCSFFRYNKSTKTSCHSLPITVSGCDLVRIHKLQTPRLPGFVGIDLLQVNAL